MKARVETVWGSDDLVVRQDNGEEIFRYHANYGSHRAIFLGNQEDIMAVKIAVKNYEPKNIETDGVMSYAIELLDQVSSAGQFRWMKDGWVSQPLVPFKKGDLTTGVVESASQFGDWVRLSSGHMSLLHVSTLKQGQKRGEIGEVINCKITAIDELGAVDVELV